jgi:fucose permease
MTAVLQAGRPWQRGYAIVGAAQLGLAACFALTARWWPRTGAGAATSGHSETARMPATLGLPGAQVGIVVFLVYSGVEASIGAWTYTLLTEGRGIASIEAGAIASLFWASVTAGRLIAAAAGRRMPVRLMLQLCAWSVVLGTTLVSLNLGALTTAAGLIVAGCACGPIFPTLIATTPARLGSTHAPNAVGFQIAASALGLSVVPGLVGVAAKAWGVETIGQLFVALAALLLVGDWLLERTAPV